MDVSSENISVILAVYNGEHTLQDALLSVLKQDVPNTEIIVVDDGSSDNSSMIIKAMTHNLEDQKLVLHHQSNKGLAASLNVGLNFARGKYIARQDQDDIVLNDRFRKQFDYLEANPEVAIVGTRAQIYVGNNPTERFHDHVLSSAAIKLELLFDNPFVHSSIMMRKDVVDELGGYSEDRQRQPPEDYELWSRIAKKYELANLPDVLTIYREMPSSMSRTGHNPFLTNVLKISAENLFFRLSSAYSFEKCLSLTKVYHGVKVSPYQRLSNSVMQKMLMQAAVKIAGPSDNWSDEFTFTFRRISKHLAYCSISHRLPKFIFKLLRKIRNAIR